MKSSQVDPPGHQRNIFSKINIEISKPNLIILQHDDKDRSILAAVRFIRKWATIRMRWELAGWLDGIIIANR